MATEESRDPDVCKEWAFNAEVAQDFDNTFSQAQLSTLSAMLGIVLRGAASKLSPGKEKYMSANATYGERNGSKTFSISVSKLKEFF